MSSTIRRDRANTGDRGQVLVLFAGGVLALLAVAALAFDVGMLYLERRDEQNAADAASLAGARYVFEPDCVAPTWTCTEARSAALAVALDNGYDDAEPNETVTIHIPPVQGRYIGLPNFIEVDIDAERASIFGGAIGQASWPISVFAVATNDQDLTFPFSMLALNKTACKAIHVSGQGEVIANGNVQSNSNGSETGCGGIGMSRTGGGEITITATDATCRAAGDIQNQGSGTMTCAQAPNSFALPDPLGGLGDPTKPALAPTMVQIGSPPKAIQPRCPGATGGGAPTETQTTGCDVAGNGGGASSSRGTKWLLAPGLYPAGLTIDNQSTVFLLPGIYWIGGGGLQVNGDASLIRVDSLATATTMNGLPMTNSTCWDDPTDPCKSLWNSNGGGVLIFNSKLPTAAGGPIDIGGGGGVLFLKAFFDPVSDPPDDVEDYNNMSIYQDRTVTSTVVFNGSNADAEVAGVVYVPSGHVQINGSSSEFTLDQVIADTFTINGSTGTIHILKRVGIDAQITAAGLVD